MSDPNTETNDLVRRALAAAVADYGERALSTPQVLRNVFDDYLPDNPRLVDVLTTAAEEGVATTLNQHLQRNMDIGTAVQLTTSSLRDRRALDPGASAWAVIEFARAMGHPVPELPAPVVGPAASAGPPPSSSAGQPASGYPPPPGYPSSSPDPAGASFAPSSPPGYGPSSPASGSQPSQPGPPSYPPGGAFQPGPPSYPPASGSQPGPPSYPPGGAFHPGSPSYPPGGAFQPGSPTFPLAGASQPAPPSFIPSGASQPAPPGYGPYTPPIPPPPRQPQPPTYMPPGGGSGWPPSPPGGPTPTPAKKRNPALFGGLAVVLLVVVYFGVAAAAKLPPFSNSTTTTTPPPPPSTASSAPPNSTGGGSALPTLQSLLPDDVSNCMSFTNPPSGLESAVTNKLCDDAGLGTGAQVYGYQFASNGAYEAALLAYNNDKSFDQATAGSSCPPSGSSSEGQDTWHDKAGATGLLECLSVNGTAANTSDPVYIWTIPADNIIFEAIGPDGSRFSALDTWWTNHAQG